MPRTIILMILCLGCSPSSPAPSDNHRESIVGTSDSAPQEFPEDREEDLRIKPTDWFEDITRQCGVNFAYRNGREAGRYTILESIGGGVAMFDYDCDGDLDLFFTGGGGFSDDPVRVTGTASALFRNEGDLKFSDVTRECGLSEPIDYSHGTAVADFDRDGYPDLFVCCYGKSRLYRNIEGREFVDFTEAAGIRTSGWCTAAAWGDINSDGLPDLMVVRYLDWSRQKKKRCLNAAGQQEVCSPGRYEAVSDLVFRNRGDGTFEEVSESVGFSQRGKGLGVVAADLNLDGLLDYYVANDETENLFYAGRPDGSVGEMGVLAGVAVNEYGMHDGSMGVDVGDVDGDGLPEIWVTNFESEDNALYRNLGQSIFAPVTTKMSLAGHSRRQVGFGTALADFDGDGFLDIVVANGHVFYHGGQLPYLQRPQLFRNIGGERFENLSDRGGTYFRSGHSSRGVAVGDLDNDGGLDLVIVHQNDPVTVLRNRFPMKHFIRLKLTGEQATREAVGATVTTVTSQRKITTSVKSGAGYLSHFDQRILLPAAPDERVTVVVKWPGGSEEEFSGLTPGTTHELVQGGGGRRD